MDLLTTVAVIMLILWIIGVVKPNLMGRFIHVLLVIAIVIILVRIIHGC